MSFKFVLVLQPRSLLSDIYHVPGYLQLQHRTWHRLSLYKIYD